MQRTQDQWVSEMLIKARTRETGCSKRDREIERQRDRERGTEKEAHRGIVSRVEVCATQTSLSRITQTSWKTMEHYDRSSTTNPLSEIAVDLTDNGGQSYVAQEIHSYENERMCVCVCERGREREKLQFLQ